MTRQFTLTFFLLDRRIELGADYPTREWLRSIPLATFAEVEAIGHRVARANEPLAADRPPHRLAAEYANELRKLFPDERIEVEAVLHKSKSDE